MTVFVVCVLLCLLLHCKGALVAQDHRADCVVAMGGSAVIDAAKTIAAIVYADVDHKKVAKRLMAAAKKPR